MADFVHLHLHTEYSLLDGVSKVKPLVAKVKELGMNACSITDHGVMYGVHEFWKECKENDIKPIIGCEVYIAERTRHDRDSQVDSQRYHLTLLAKNLEGYHNLIRLTAKGFTEGFYYKPRVDRELLQQYGKGIIALSGCLSSNFNRLLASGKRKEAVEWIKFLQTSFSEVYIEIQRNGIADSEKLIPEQRAIAAELGLDVVATCDTHYIEPEDYKLQEVAWCIGDGTKLDDPTRRQYNSTEFYLKSPSQMAELYADIPEVVANTQKLADGVEIYNIEFERVQPRFDPNLDQDTIRKMLREHTYAGAKKRYGELTDAITQRLDYELGVIMDKGYTDYFLVVEDYIKWAKDQGILVGPGRGSGAGSVVAYSLEITNLDPFAYDLIFERFLNPERPSPPDFDIDFQDDRRDELFQYTSHKYGRDNTAYIGTFGKLKTRAAIRDIARVMGIDLATADKLSKLVIVKFGRVHTVKMMMEEVPEFAEIVNSDPRIKELMEYVSKLAGIARHVSIHACGYLITPEPITEYVPVQLETKGGDKVITQFEGHLIESLGLMKFDFLGLTNLTIISNVLKQIEYARQEKLDIDAIPLDDAKTYALFQRGDTNAIFQFESDGMKKYLRDLKPTEFEDLIFMAAAYRPGPMEYIPSYINRKFGREQVTYPHPSVEEILKTTYGYAIYQEQVINIAVEFAGYSLGEADMLRRAMGKKKPEVMAKEKEKFREKALKQDREEKKIDEIWHYLEPFADYGFNRSHAAAYALISYQTAYLKANYTLEFMAGLMETDIDKSDKLKRDLEEARHLGIEVLPPDVNASYYSFSIEGENAIRCGLGGIKGTSEKVMKEIAKVRRERGAFAHLDDLIHCVGPENLSKKDLELLIKVGAMDSFGERNQLLAVMPAVFELASKKKSISTTGQRDLFSVGQPDGTSPTVELTPLPQLDPVPEAQKIHWEKQLLGVFLTTHPLDYYEWTSILPDYSSLSNLQEAFEGKRVKVLAIIDSQKIIRTKTDNKQMSFLTLADRVGELEAVMFSRTHMEYAGRLEEAKPYIFEGSVSMRNDLPSLLIDTITPADTLTPPSRITLNICDIHDEDLLKRIKTCLLKEGPVLVRILYGERSQPKEITRYTNLTAPIIAILQPYIVI